MNETNTIKKLSERDHIRQRPAMYIGSVTSTKSFEYILEDEKVQYKEVEYVPGLVKIINEIIDNSVDVAIKTNFKSSNLIQVNIDDKHITVEDNGTGIPVKKVDGHFLPELCWNHARAGSNFNDDENRTQIGMNGVGSYSTACFSKEFVGNTDDGINQYTIKIINGAESFEENIKKSKGKTGTLVSFYPDLEMFGLTEIDEVTRLIIKQRLINLSMSFPQIKFKFNKKLIKTNNFKSYLKMFNDTFVEYESEQYRFAILPNDSDDFKQFSYVNGLRIPDGGTHIDVISRTVVEGIREKLSRKYKNIKPGDIRNKLMIICFIKDLKNPKFNSQAKEKITNSIKEINSYFGDIPYDRIIAKVLKTPEIIDNITEVYRIKEELQRRKELKELDKSKKKPKNEKFIPPTKKWKQLVIAEGDSAQTKTASTFDRAFTGFFAMFGVPLNAYSSSVSDIAKSTKMLALKEIIGLNFSTDVQNNLNFEEYIIATDYDLPGHFIAGQLLGLFWKFAPNLIQEGKVKRFVTPLIVGYYKEKISIWFYKFEDYQEYTRNNPKEAKKYKFSYQKGLGSWDNDDLLMVLEKDGMESMLEVFQPDDDTKSILDSWLGSENADLRKEMLEDYEFNIMNQ